MLSSKVVVCLASYNGSSFLREQIVSILQSNLVNQLIISDDGSIDGTLDVINSIDDNRIKLIKGPCRGVVSNFEFLLKFIDGDFIFLADQDDIWDKDKVPVLLKYLEMYDLVVSDCVVVDEKKEVILQSFYDFNNSRSGFINNLYKNSYVGCCMAFRGSLLKFILPFPDSYSLPMHDWWIGLIAELFGRVKFVDEKLILYRRHSFNTSSTTQLSKNSLFIKIKWRLLIAFSLVFRLLKFKFPYFKKINS